MHEQIYRNKPSLAIALAGNGLVWGIPRESPLHWLLPRTAHAQVSVRTHKGGEPGYVATLRFTELVLNFIKAYRYS